MHCCASVCQCWRGVCMIRCVGLEEGEARVRGLRRPGCAHGFSMLAMLVNGRGVLILVVMSFPRCAICAWMYMRKVRELHRPCFMIVVSSRPWSFIAIAPPARREWTPMRSGSMPWWCSCIWTTVARSWCRMSDGVTLHHMPSSDR